jgi:hypothetical protein
MIVIAKDCKAEFLHILIKSAVQQRVPYLILPSFSNMLREACQVKSAFCFAIRTETGLQNAMKDYHEKSKNRKVEKMSKKSKQKTTEQVTGTTEDDENAEVGMDLDEDMGEAKEKKLKKQVEEEILEAEALEAAVDDLREYLATLIAAENNQ